MTKRTSSSSKRRGSNANGGEPTLQTSERESSQDWVEDEEYYLRDGDVIILAERTGFKLSRFVLRRGSTLMEELLESPEPVEMSITETAEDVRALAWATHSFPTDVADHQNKASITRLISVLYICHKLQFLPHAQWAKRAIFGSILSGALGSSATSDEAIEALDSILSCASERDMAKLLMALTPCSLPDCPICTAGVEECVGAVWGLWLLRLQNDASLSSRRAICCAKALGLRSFLGRLYYTQLVITNSRAKFQADLPGTTACEDPELDLTEEQTAALHRGHWSLSVFWETVRHPPEIDTADQASHDWECYAAWEQMWHEGIYGDGESPYPWNPIGALLRLAQLETPLENGELGIDEDEEDAVARCGCFFREEARSMRQRLLGTLADHFVKPGTPPEAYSPPELCPTKIVITPTTLAFIRNERLAVHRIAPVTASPNVQKVKQPKKKSSEQRKLEANAAKQHATTSAHADPTTAILQRAWALQMSSGAIPSSSQTEQDQTMDPPEASRIRDSVTPEREFAEGQFSEPHQDATSGSFSIPESSEDAPLQENDIIVIEDTPPPSSPPPPPPPPLSLPFDRAASLPYFSESDEGPPTQNFLFFKQGAQPTKIPKALFDHHGRSVPN